MAKKPKVTGQLHLLTAVAGDLLHKIDTFAESYVAAHHARTILHLAVFQVVTRERPPKGHTEAPAPRVSETGFAVTYDFKATAPLMIINNLVAKVRGALFRILIPTYTDPDMMQDNPGVVETQGMVSGVLLDAPASSTIDSMTRGFEIGFRNGQTPITRIVRCIPGAHPGHVVQHVQEFAPFIWEDEVPGRCIHAPDVAG